MPFLTKVAVLAESSLHDLIDLPVTVISARVTEEDPGDEGSYWEPASAPYRVYAIKRIEIDFKGLEEAKEDLSSIKIGDRVKAYFSFPGDEMERVEVEEDSARVLAVAWKKDILTLDTQMTGIWQGEKPLQSDKGHYRATIGG